MRARLGWLGACQCCRAYLMDGRAVGVSPSFAACFYLSRKRPMKAWMTKALDLLRASLEPPKHELNECDWKAGLSPDKKRLACTSSVAFRPGSVIRGDPHQHDDTVAGVGIGNHQAAVKRGLRAFEGCAEADHAGAKISPSRFNSAASCLSRCTTSGALPSAMAIRSTAMGAQPRVTGVHSGQCV